MVTTLPPNPLLIIWPQPARGPVASLLMVSPPERASLSIPTVCSPAGAQYGKSRHADTSVEIRIAGEHIARSSPKTRSSPDIRPRRASLCLIGMTSSINTVASLAYALLAALLVPAAFSTIRIRCGGAVLIIKQSKQCLELWFCSFPWELHTFC